MRSGKITGSSTISARNRNNARKSTGPRTALGKAIVSANARRHGATSKPDPTSVAAWVRIILDKPDLSPGDLLSGDPRVAGALALAEAEVRLCCARAALDKFETGERPPPDTGPDFRERAEDLMAALHSGHLTEEAFRSGIALLRGTQTMVNGETAQGGNRHKLLRRYVREARGHHRRAFQSWLGYLAKTTAPTEDLVQNLNLPKQSQNTI